MREKNAREIKIKKALLDKGIIQKEIAKELNIHETGISLYISGRKKSKRFEKWLKENIGEID